MEKQSIQHSEGDSLVRLNALFGKIRIPKYVNRTDIYYIDKGFDVGKLRKDLYKTDLEDYTNHLIFAGFEFKMLQESEFEGTLIRLKEEVTNAKILKVLRDISHSRLSFSLNNFNKGILHVSSKVITEAIQEALEKQFEKQDGELYVKISDEELKNFIIREEAIAFRTGAPSIMHRIAKLAEILIFLIHYEENFNFTPETIDTFSNKDCRLVHDYLVFWGLIEDKSYQNINHIYIRTMISNLRRQRKNGFIK